MKWITLILFSLLSISARSQTIRGKVIDANTRQPISGASVGIYKQNKTQQTDKQGEFSISNLEIGR